MTKFLSLVTIGVAVLAMAAGCSKRDAEPTKAAPPAPAVKGVAIETVKMTAIPETLEAIGTVRARSTAVVASRIPGTISVLAVREGDRVRQGDPLIELEAQEHLANTGMAEAAVEVARQGVDEAKARRDLAASTFDRYQRLFAEQAVTRQEFEIKQTERALAVQAVAQAAARLRQAEEGARAAATLAGYTRIVAPVAGTIVAKQTDLGATVFPGQPLLMIESEQYRLELAVPESWAARLKPGTGVEVRIPALNAGARSRIVEMVPAADPLSRTITAKVSLDMNGLKSGLFGRGLIATGASTTVITLPEKAVMERGALTALWVVALDNTAGLRLVKVGGRFGDRVEILAGLLAGERVVVADVDKISEGARVE